MGITRRSASRRGIVAGVVTTLVLAACSGTAAPDDAADDAAGGIEDGSTAPTTTTPAPIAPPTQPPAEDDADDLPPIGRINPDLDWPWTEDLARMDAFPALLDAAFEAGTKEGLRFLAAHSWPDGYTADALLACRVPEPTPTYRELDADGWRYRWEFRPVSPAPGFQYPPTGEHPAASGLRVYLGRLIVVTERAGETVHTFDDIGRMAVRGDGTVVMFPTCFEFLPGQILEHRVTDGDVGGYTDAEAEGDIRLIFTNSPSHLQAEVCERLAARDFDALEYMIMPFDIEFTEASIPRRVMDRTLTDLCRSRIR
jgi:hypothetical protein